MTAEPPFSENSPSENTNTSSQKEYTPVKRTLAVRFQDAFRGIFHAVREEPNMILYGLAILCVTGLGFWVGISPAEWAIIILTTGVVIAGEIINTALESVVDLASPGFHPLAGIAKDCAAGAVVVLSFAAIMIAFIIFVPHFIKLFS